MIDFESRKIIEALRSGVSSRAAGQYFSSARQDLLADISKKLSGACESKASGGMIVSGRYGEGKTHLLNTVFSMAHSENMVVSLISVSKETPFNMLYLVYKKMLSNTYLPGRLQPGFMDTLMNMTEGSPLAVDMLAYTAKQLDVDKLYYLLRSYFKTTDMDEKYLIQADLEGDFISNKSLKQIYKRICSEKVDYNVNFSKTKHMSDYFSMMSRLFQCMGYSGWVILVDEAELIRGLGKKARLKAYRNMAGFLFPDAKQQATYSIFTMTDDYYDDVIEGKNEFDNLNESDFEQADRELVEKALEGIASAKQLVQLDKEEILMIMEKLIDFYKKAYDWHQEIDMGEILLRTDNRGYLLRTRIRACVEYLDQLYQYNEVSDIKINELGQASYEEDVPSLEGLTGM